MTIHAEIDNYRSADLPSHLSDEGQNALHVHLVECASWRRAHQETKIMNKVLEEKFTNEKPDSAFEQRLLAGFRNRISNRPGTIAKFIVDLMRLRATQITAVAAVLLALVQVGRLITGEGPRSLRNREYDVREEFAQRSASISHGRNASDLKAKKTEQEGGANFADTYRKDDIT